MSEVAAYKQECLKVFKEVGIALGGSVGLALLSQVAIPLPFTPIPVTLQTLGVFLLGGLLGSRRGFYAVFAYLIQGCLGLPVFAGGVANPLWICGIQAGFLLSFLGAVYLIGKMVQRSVFWALLVGQLAMWGGGASWMACYVGWYKAFWLGVVPFVMGAGLKIGVGVGLIRLGRRRWR